MATVRQVGASLLIVGASITGLIIPWLAVYAASSAFNAKSQKQKQMKTAESLALNNLKYDPYAAIFPTTEAREKYKKLSLNEIGTVGPLKRFYLSISGQRVETESQKMIREAYEAKKLAPRSDKSMKRLDDIYTLLSNPFGQLMFQRAHQNALKAEKSLTAFNSKTITGRLMAYDARTNMKHEKRVVTTPQNKKKEKAISAETIERLSFYKACKRNRDVKDVFYTTRRPFAV